MEPLLIRTGRKGSTEHSRGELRGPDWLPVARSIRARVDAALDMAAYVRAHQLRSTKQLVACDWTAAALWALPLPSKIGLDIDAIPLCLAALPEQAHDRCNGVRGRRLALPQRHIHLMAGLYVTSPARTWLDCSAFVSREFSVAIADDALHRGLTDRGDLNELVAWGRGRRGIRTARTALDLADARSESPRESWLRASLVLFGLPRPEVNLEIFDEDRWLARVDLAWPEFRVIVEYDGREYHRPEHHDHDARRRMALHTAGWNVLVFRAEDLGNMVDVGLTISSALRAGGYAG